MHKKINIYKNKIIITIVIAIFLMIPVGVGSFIFIINTAIHSFSDDCTEFNNAVEKTTQLMEETIIQKKNTLSLYAEIMQPLLNSSPNSIRERITALERLEEFNSIVLIKEDGSMLYSTEDTAKPILEQAQYIIQSLQMKNSDLYVLKGTENTVIYAVPVYNNAGQHIFIAATLSAQLNKAIYSSIIQESRSRLYMLNPQNEIIAFLDTSDSQFDYASIPRKQFFSNYKNENKSVSEKKPIVEYINKFDITPLAHFQILITENTFLWYENSFSYSSLEGWKVLAAKAIALSPESKANILTVSILTVIVSLFLFLSLITFILFQGISNWKLGKIAYTDFVTGHYNWNHFQSAAIKVLRRKKNKNYAMVTFDIRKFRIISDLNGYSNSDELLKLISDILKKYISRNELFARFAIDEFALLLVYEGTDNLIARITHIDELLKGQTAIQQLAFSYGIYYINDYKMHIQRMYTYSSMAKDMIKKNHDICIGIFTDDLREEIIREKSFESNMHHALAYKEFQVYLQPKYNPSGKHIQGAEALVRWNSPVMGFIPPSAFIPLFEKNGFIMHLDMYMIEEICICQQKWLKKGYDLITISVNVSRIHLTDPHLVEHITEIIDSYQIPHECIELELTESAFFDNKTALLNTVYELRKRGIPVSMDDFGSGFSSLNSLKDLPLDVIKLDGEFFKETENKERSKTVIRDTITLAKHLNMKIVAEGIETKEQVDFLHTIGCDLIQGFYFARPMPIADFEKLMGYDDTDL